MLLSTLLMMLADHSTLLLNLQRSPFQILRIPCLVSLLIMSSNQKWRIREQIIHFLERESRRLRQKEIEEERIGKVTDNEKEVIAVANIGHSYVCDLSDQCVEGKGYHGGDGYTFGASTCVEDFGGDDPG